MATVPNEMAPMPNQMAFVPHQMALVPHQLALISASRSARCFCINFATAEAPSVSLPLADER